MATKPAATKAAGAPVELSPEKLRWRCEQARIPFETTAQAQPLEGVIEIGRAHV